METINSWTRKQRLAIQWAEREDLVRLRVSLWRLDFAGASAGHWAASLVLGILVCAALVWGVS